MEKAFQTFPTIDSQEDTQYFKGNWFMFSLEESETSDERPKESTFRKY